MFAPAVDELLARLVSTASPGLTAELLVTLALLVSVPTMFGAVTVNESVADIPTPRPPMFQMPVAGVNRPCDAIDDVGTSAGNAGKLSWTLIPYAGSPPRFLTVSVYVTGWPES